MIRMVSGLFCASEADKRLRTIGWMTVAILNPEIYWSSVKTTTAYDAPGFHLEEVRPVAKPVASRNRVFLRGGWVGLPFIGEELPDIARHVKDPIAVRWVLPDRRC